MNSHRWKAETLKLLESMPLGKRFFAAEIALLFNSRGPSANLVGRYLSTLPLVEIDHLDHQRGYVWRRI